MVEDRRVELLTHPCHGCVIPLHQSPALWCPLPDSNRPPTDYKSVALPDELKGHILYETTKFGLGGVFIADVAFPYSPATFSNVFPIATMFCFAIFTPPV
jgi:hypothetical protein